MPGHGAISLSRPSPFLSHILLSHLPSIRHSFVTEGSVTGAIFVLIAADTGTERMRSGRMYAYIPAVCHLLLASLWRVQLQSLFPMLLSAPSCEAQRSSGRKTENNSGFANSPPLRHGSSPATASPSSADAQLCQMPAALILGRRHSEREIASARERGGSEEGQSRFAASTQAGF